MNTLSKLSALSTLAPLVLSAFVLAACSGATTITSPPEGEESSQEEASDTKLPKSGKSESSDGDTKSGSSSSSPSSDSKSSGDGSGAGTGTGGGTGTGTGGGAGGTGGTGGTPGEPGQPGRVSVNEHCCYAGKYYKCPSPAACFGGFDIDACLDKCGSAFDSCFEACFDKLETAGAPVGCTTPAAPKGVDCAGGQINL